MIKITVRSFAMIREVIGHKRLNLSFDESKTIHQVINYLIQKFPEIEQYLKPDGEINPSYVFAIDGDIITLENIDKIQVQESQVLAILPPAGGGMS